MEITTETVTDYLLKINAKKSTGPDSFSPKIIKLSALAIASPLANLFNHCIRISALPSEWKMSNVTPIHKKGETTDKNNNLQDFRKSNVWSTVHFFYINFLIYYVGLSQGTFLSYGVDQINRWWETRSGLKERCGCGCHRSIKGFRLYLP